MRECEMCGKESRIIYRACIDCVCTSDQIEHTELINFLERENTQLKKDVAYYQRRVVQLDELRENQHKMIISLKPNGKDDTPK